MDVVTQESERRASLRRICLLDYLLHIAGLLFSAGLLSILALFINYAKRGDARGTIYESHMTWMIRTFWWTVFWVIVSFLPILLLAAVTLGLLSFLFVIPLIWFLYRMVVGLLRLLDDRPMPV
jgi:uncharacterized membrane protein